MHYTQGMLCLLLVILCPLPARGADSFPQSSPPAKASDSSAQEERDILRPGDVISINLAGFPEESIKELRIPVDGRISFYNVKDYKITGKTRAQVERELRERVGELIRDPQISVNLISSPYAQVVVNGAVEKPGAIVYREGLTISNALAEAGGLRATAGKEIRLTTRKKGEIITLNLNLEAVLQGDPQANLTLQPGDLLYIPEATIHIIGEVSRPGAYPLKEAENVLKALATASGPTALADLTNVYIRRGNQTLQANVQFLVPGQASGEPSANSYMELQPGDVLIIPPLREKVYVFGAVTRPGEIPIWPKTKDKLLDAISGAGGALAQADLKNIVVRRMGPQNSFIEARVNLSPNGPPGDNIILLPGDQIFVPFRKQKDRTTPLVYFGTFLGLISTLRGRF